MKAKGEGGRRRKVEGTGDSQACQGRREARGWRRRMKERSKDVRGKGRKEGVKVEEENEERKE